MQIVLLVEVGDAHPPGPFLFVSVPKDQTALKLAADALQRGAGQDPLRGPTLADIEVDARCRVGGMHDPCDVAIRDQAHPGSHGADRGNDLGVPRPVEDADGDLLCRHTLGRGKGPHIVRR